MKAQSQRPGGTSKSSSRRSVRSWSCCNINIADCQAMTVLFLSSPRAAAHPRHLVEACLLLLFWHFTFQVEICELDLNIQGQNLKIPNV